MAKPIVSGRRGILTSASANWAGFVAQLVIAFFMSPILVRGLGDRRYGIWSLVESIVAYLTLCDLGIAASVVKYVAKFDATDDQRTLNRIFSTSIALFSAIALAIVAVVSLFFLTGQRLPGVPPDLETEARWLLGLLAANVAVGLPMGVFASALDGLQRFPAKAAVRTGLLVARSLLLLAVVRGGGGLIALGVVLTACGLADHLILALLVRHYLPGLRFSAGTVDRATFRMIRGYSASAFLGMLAGRVAFQTDAIVIGAFLLPQHITYFVVGARLVDYAKGMVATVATVLTPVVSGFEARGDAEAIRRVLIGGARSVAWFILPVQVGLVILGRPFLRLWMGQEFAAVSYPILVILALPLGVATSQYVTGRVFYGMGQLRGFTRMLAVEAVANLVLSLLLVKPLGIEGVAWGTAIPNLLLNVGIAAYVCRTLGIGLGEYVGRSFLKPLLLLPVPAALWLAGSLWGPPMGWARLIAVTGLGVTAYALGGLCLEFGPRTVLGTVKRLAGTVAPRPS